MPVNFYKGENMNQETKIALPLTCTAILVRGLKSHILIFLIKIIKMIYKIFKNIKQLKNNLSNFNLLKTYLDDEYMGRYLAYLVLSQNFHSSRIHNNRLIIDPWRGQVFPV